MSSSPFVQQAAAESQPQSQSQSLDEKNPAKVTADASGTDSEIEKEEAQNGVKKIQAITTAWTWRALILTYIL